MAVDVCSEPSSPRISFSHDLQDSDDIVPIEECHQRCMPHSDPFLIEFDFCTAAHHHGFSSADELFADGKILPVGIKKIQESRPKSKPAPEISGAHENRKMLKEFLTANIESEEEEEESPPAKHFLKFRRSSSLNFDIRRRSSNAAGLVRSLQFLSRSHSTGSAPNPTAAAAPDTGRKQRSKSEPFVTRSVSSLLFNSNYGQLSSSSKRTNNSNLLKKSRSCRSNYSSGHGIRISPVLNISPNYISKHTFFGLGSLFNCNGKSKKKKI